MKHIYIESEKATAWLSAMLTGFLGVYFYYPIINPLNVSWIIHEGDVFQHYIGWAFYKNESWVWPLGIIQNLATDLQTSVVFTDSIPLIAIPLKLFNSWLPESFQYQGIWMVFNFFLNGFFAARLLIVLKIPRFISFLGAILITMSPVSMMRGVGFHGHESLVAHWLIFLALEYLIKFEEQSMESFFSWLMLLLLSVLIHFYIFAMVFLLWVGWCLMMYLEHKNNARRSFYVAQMFLVYVFVTIVILYFFMYGAGYFLPNREAPSGGGFGFFSSELLTFFNPRSTAWFFDDKFPSLSSWFLGWKTPIQGQYEGTSYAGTGILLIWIFAVLIIFLKKDACSNFFVFTKSVWVAFAVTIGMFFYATAGNISLPNISFSIIPNELFGPIRSYLRSSGRMVWPLFYLLTVIALAIIAGRLKKEISIPLLLIMVGIQFFDLNLWHKKFYNRIREVSVLGEKDHMPFSVLKDKDLKYIWKRKMHLVAFPAEDLGKLKPYLWIASKHQLSINIAYLANQSKDVVDKATNHYGKILSSGSLDEDKIYLITSKSFNYQKLCDEKNWKCKNHDDIIIIWCDGFKTEVQYHLM